MRSIIIALLLGSALVLGACLPDSEQVKLSFENNSDSELCFNLTKVSRGYCDEVEARGTTVWRPECHLKQALTIVLSVAEGRREIYNRTATCEEWIASGAKFTIEQRGGELVVTDSLPDASPSP